MNMGSDRISRRGVVTGFGATAMLSALAASTGSGPAEAAPVSAEPAHGLDHAHPSGDPLVPRTPRQVALHDLMRRLWTDHALWTRLAIVTFAGGTAGFDANAERLLANQTDIGNAVKPFYGVNAGNRLTELLREHILIAVALLQAAKAADNTALEAARVRWYANANVIADFLAAANPRNWPRASLRLAMRVHLDQTLSEATHELTGDYVKSVADYAQIQTHLLAMADQLSSGIMRQFPQRFR